MQENEFEKQVKNMMEQFKTSPSNDAWEKVSRRIHAGKHKKKYLIFLLLAGLITAGYFSYTVFEKNKGNSKTYTVEKKNSAVEKDLVEKKSKKAGNDFVSDTLKINHEKAVAENNKQNTFHKRINALNDKQVLLKQHNVAENTLVNNEANKNGALPFEPGALSSKENSEKNNINIQPAKTGSIAFENKKQVYTDSPLINTTTDNFNSLQPIKNSSNKNFIQTDSANQLHNNTAGKSNTSTKKSPASNNKIPNWQLGITAFYGKSNLVEHLISFNKSAMDYISPSGVFNNPDSFHNGKLYTSSEAFHIGGIVQKRVAKNAVIGFGLNFTRLSAKSVVGRQVDSAAYFLNANGIANLFVQGFYQPGNSSAYKSNFNFIELPVYFQQDIFHANKISFAYNAGFSIRRLLSSNALIYDAGNNIYFSKDELFHKTQLQFLAGLKLNFNTNKNSTFFIAPQFQYNFSGLLKNSNGYNYHLINYGLQAGFLLNKK